MVWLPFIPEMIMEDIFHRLPYKPMILSKLVCKTWYSIISSPKFIDGHNNLRPEGNHFIFLHHFETEQGYDLNFYTASHSSLADKRLLSSTMTPIQFPMKRTSWGYGQPQLLGSYNGLVAISLDDELILWNPLTKEHSSVQAKIDCNFNFDPRLLLGLCYDGSMDEYSVVVGKDCQSPPVSPTCFDYEFYESISVHLCNFKYGGQRMLHDTALGYRLLAWKLYDGEVGKVIRGVPHWVVEYYDFIDLILKRDILYFDLKQEMFKVMAIPNISGVKTVIGLAGMDGDNQLGCVLDDESSSSFEVWVMKEYGKSESWSNMFTLPYMNLSKNFASIKYMEIMGFMPNGELLVYLNDKEFWVYNIQTVTCRKIKLSRGENFSFVITYMPKLISPPD